MKKINSKGFTLIELLAVIVVLAIVMVIATTTILNSTRTAAQDSLHTSALSVADYVKKQEGLRVLNTAETCYNTWYGSTTTGDISSSKVDGGKTIEDDNSSCFGLNTTDYDLSESKIIFNNANGIATVKLCGTKDGKFGNVEANTSLSLTGSTDTLGACVTVTK